MYLVAAFNDFASLRFQLINLLTAEQANAFKSFQDLPEVTSRHTSIVTSIVTCHIHLESPSGPVLFQKF